MRLTRHRRWAVPIVAAAAVGLTLTACTGDIANEDAGDVDCSDYEEYGTFDGAVCGEVLEHLEDDRTAMGEIARVLAPGGVLVATVPANPWRYDWLDHWAGHQRRYTPEGMGAKLREAGFDEVVVEPWGFPLTGLYHRKLFMPVLRRRLEAAGGKPPGAPGKGLRPLFPLVRAALELDSLFIGRRPGYFGLIARARKAR